MNARNLVIDNFAGGGGASSGIEAALGRPVDVAINHDPEAIAMHRVNHPNTKHLQTSVWDVDPRKIARGKHVGLGWFSPDCTFHSKARGSKPFRDRNVARRRRGLAGIVPRWLDATKMDVFMLENVEEFADWGPLLADGTVCQRRKGMLFRRWHRQIENLGYRIDMREIRACDYGAPTTRKRLFVIGRRDGREIVFPEATHGEHHWQQRYRTAADCIDFNDLGHSIFMTPEEGREAGVRRPLAENTLRRIHRGILKYAVNNPKPFILRPYNTITAEGSQGALVATFLARHYGGNENDGSAMGRPMHTITARDHHALVAAFLLKYYGTEQDPRIGSPLDTITTKARFGLVTVQLNGEPYYIADIRMRMLKPRELFLANSFRSNYIIDRGIDEDGAIIKLTQESQVRMCGNSVPPAAAEALVRANVVDQRLGRAA